MMHLLNYLIYHLEADGSAVFICMDKYSKVAAVVAALDEAAIAPFHGTIVKDFWVADSAGWALVMAVEQPLVHQHFAETFHMCSTA